jgi:two-component system response regulator AdeR
VDYEERLQIFKLEKPDISLRDIHLPGKNGIELLKYTRLNGKLCRVLMMTSQADEYYRRFVLQLGADYCFTRTMNFQGFTENFHQNKLQKSFLYQ